MLRSPVPTSTGGSTIVEPPAPRRPRAPSRLAEEVGPPPDFLDGDGGGGDGRGGGGGGGGGGWGGGPGDGEGEGGEGREPFARPLAASEFAFGFLLLGVATLFGVFLAAFLMLRRQAATWPPPGAPDPPTGLWISTALVFASSIALLASDRAARRREASAMRRHLGLATALGTLFLVSQGLLWSALLRSGYTAGSDAYGAVFYSLTGLHALHALGGVVLLLHLAWRSRRRPLTADTRLRLRLAGLYWHFLGLIWVVLFVVLYYVE